MTVFELNKLSQVPLEVKSSYNGKILCKAFNKDKNAAIGERLVVSMWPEIKIPSGQIFANYARPVICVYASGEIECRQDQEKKARKA